MKLSENFYLAEFVYSKDANIQVSVTPFQMFLLKRLINNILQPVRSYYKKPFIIHSGVRNKRIMEVLKAKGYPVSLHTDHSYGDPEVNPYGTGAVDFSVNNTKDLVDIYIWIKNNIDNNLIGQLILYTRKNPENNYFCDFIHVSNSLDVFMEVLKEFRQKEKFLMRKDDKYVSIDLTIFKYNT